MAEDNVPVEGTDTETEAVLANFRRPVRPATKPTRPVTETEPENDALSPVLPVSLLGDAPGPAVVTVEDLPDVVMDYNTPIPIPEADIAPDLPVFDESVFAPDLGPVPAPSAGTAGVRVEQAAEDRINLTELLRYMVNSNGSDLHLALGAPPLVRVDGKIRPVPGYNRLTARPLNAALMTILSEPQRKEFQDHWELNFAHVVPDLARFRVNLMKQRGHTGAVFRVIPTEIKPLETLGLPPILYNFAALPRGLVLVTGPTGSGKSTTLASLIDRANRTRSGHIITIEDPIEFIHPHRSCVVNQREIGSDTVSFSEALRNVLRQDPDIILIGELRDLETISTALTAAETGHLVFATLHTQSAQDTVNRIIDVFPSGQQQQIRSQVAATLKGVVCQTLVRRADGKGRIPAAEVMIVTNGIANMIRTDDTHQIHQALQSGGQVGMQTLNQHLAELVASNMIDRESAEEVATDLKDLDQLITGRSTGIKDRNIPRIDLGGLTGSSI